MLSTVADRWTVSKEVKRIMRNTDGNGMKEHLKFIFELESDRPNELSKVLVHFISGRLVRVPEDGVNKIDSREISAGTFGRYG